MSRTELTTAELLAYLRQFPLHAPVVVFEEDIDDALATASGLDPLADPDDSDLVDCVVLEDVLPRHLLTSRRAPTPPAVLAPDRFDVTPSAEALPPAPPAAPPSPAPSPAGLAPAVPEPSSDTPDHPSPSAGALSQTDPPDTPATSADTPHVPPRRRRRAPVDPDQLSLFEPSP